VSGSELAYLPAQAQLALFRARTLSPVEVLHAQIARIEAVNGRVNALTHRHFDEALAAAKAAEARYLAGAPRPLDGITVALKDEYDHAGWITNAGSKLFKDDVKKKNHPVVDKLLAAGAVLHVETTVPEFYFAAVTWSDLCGVTRNPWNLEITPGGSSGGSAAALAAGMTTLATGSDVGGSIRIPAALCGLYGFKPPFGRVATAPKSALLVQASLGPMARTFDDMILLSNVMAGPAPGSLSTLRPKLEMPKTYPALKGQKIALSMDQGWAEIAADVRDNTLAAVRCLEQAGAIVEEVALGLDITAKELRETMDKILLSGSTGADMAALRSKAEHLTTYGRHFVELAATMGPQQAREAEDAAVRLYQAVDENVFQKGYSVLITPTVASTDIAANYDPTRDAPVINGRKGDPYVGWHLTPLFNLLNFMPVITVPTGRAVNNVPTGMQIAAQTYDDLTAAAVASAYAQAAPQLFTEGAFPDLG
jgi:amidase